MTENAKIWDDIRRAERVFTGRLLHAAKHTFFAAEHLSLIGSNPLLENPELTRREDMMAHLAVEYISRIQQGVLTDYAKTAAEISHDKQAFYEATAKAFDLTVDEVKQRQRADETFDEFVSRFSATVKSVFENHQKRLRDAEQRIP